MLDSKLTKKNNLSYTNKLIPTSNSGPLQLNSFEYISSSTVQFSKEKGRWSKAKQGLISGLLDGASLGLKATSYLANTDTSLSLTFGIPLASVAIGGLWGGVSGFYSGYDIYHNSHSDQYAEELQTYRDWLEQREEGLSDYQSGNFFEDADRIHGMLQEGKVMYIYDVDEHLKVSGNHDPIKHAILADNKDVYAAGTSSLQNDQKDKIEEAIGWVHTRDENLGNIAETGDKEGGYRQWVTKSQEEILKAGYEQDVSMQYLVDMFNNIVIEKSDCTLSVTDDSGHYHLGYASGHAALEAWKKIGYSNINWEPRWHKKKWYQQTVINVSN